MIAEPVQESQNQLQILGKRKIFPTLKRQEMDQDLDPDNTTNTSEIVEIFPQNPGQGTSHMVVTPSENSIGKSNF